MIKYYLSYNPDGNIYVIELTGELNPADESTFKSEKNRMIYLNYDIKGDMLNYDTWHDAGLYDAQSLIKVLMR